MKCNSQWNLLLSCSHVGPLVHQQISRCIVFIFISEEQHVPSIQTANKDLNTLCIFSLFCIRSMLFHQEQSLYSFIFGLFLSVLTLSQNHLLMFHRHIKGISENIKMSAWHWCFFFFKDCLKIPHCTLILVSRAFSIKDEWQVQSCPI